MRKIRFIRNLNLGVKSLMLHKLRSALTMLGVVFGVGSVIAMLAIGEGSKKAALEQIEKLGTNNIIISSRKPAVTDPNAASQGNVVLNYGIHYEDEDRVRDTIADLRRVVPVRQLPKIAYVQDRAAEINVSGITPEWFQLVHRDVIAGRILTRNDMDHLAPVVVFTESLARKLLATTNTLGTEVRIGDKIFTVVGIIHSETRLSESGAGTPDTGLDAFIPLTTCRDLFGELIQEESAGSSTRKLVDLQQLVVEVKDRNLVEPVARVIRTMFERFHPRGDYEISVPLELLQQAAQVQAVWNLTLGSIAGISLLVGGIGIMNIMLASVTERTREIGVRRAIGARKKQIIAQFLTESLLLSILGGIIGLFLGGVILPYIIEKFSAHMGEPIKPDVPLYSIILSVGISVSIGVIFGLYPAIRAANLDPIEALRHE